MFFQTMTLRPLLVFLITTFSIYAQTTHPIIVDPEAQPFYDLVKDWSESIHSFKGEYSLEEYNPSNDQSIRIYWQEYRYDGDKRRYLSTNIWDSKENERQLYMAMLDGVVSTLWGEANSKGDMLYQGTKEESFWRIPRGVFINPLTPFGKSMETDRFFRHGAAVFKYYKRDGYDILSQWSYETSQDIWIDKDKNIIRIEYVLRPQLLFMKETLHEYENSNCILGFNLDEVSRSKTEIIVNIYDILLNIWDKDPFDMRRIRYSIEMSGHQKIGGVSFPLWIKETGYARTNTQDVTSNWFQTIRSDFRTGKISLLDYQLSQIDEDIYGCHPNSYQLIQFTKPDELEINASLSDKDFMTPLVDGASIYNDVTGERYVYENKWHKILWLQISVGIALLILVSSIVIVYLRKR